MIKILVIFLAAYVETLSLNPSEYLINWLSVKRLNEKSRAEKYLSIKLKKINLNFTVLH